jgi:hypothetical protein
MAGLAREEQTALILRGLVRHLFQRGLIAFPEVTLPNGRRADLMAVSRAGELWIIEIKSSVEDFKADRKWREYWPYCDQFFFATHAGVPEEIFPPAEGLFLADAYGAELIRDPTPHTKLSAPTRKALLVHLAWVGGHRLWAMRDPETIHAEI